jgi:hypothetical protein
MKKQNIHPCFHQYRVERQPDQGDESEFGERIEMPFPGMKSESMIEKVVQDGADKIPKRRSMQRIKIRTFDEYKQNRELDNGNHASNDGELYELLAQ